MWSTPAPPKPDDDAYIQAFYDSLDQGNSSGAPPPASWTQAALKIQAFLATQAQPPAAAAEVLGSPSSSFAQLPRCAIVTSGSVPTPLDTQCVNYLDTLGSGNRAAACAEAFLKRGYHVLFLYREGSLRPFSRVAAKRMKKAEALTDQIQINATTGAVELVMGPEEAQQMKDTMATFAALQGRLLEVPFADLFEYLYLLREASRAAAPLGHRALLFLAAGLSKMFIPRQDLTPPSAAILDQGKEALKLSPVPHVLRAARQSWCPQAFLVAFKLANDSVSLVEGAHRQLERHGLHMVVGNTVQDRGRRVLLVTEREETNLVSPKEQELEPSMVRAVVRNHKQFTLEREALKSSRSLLGLSAKLSMLREKKSVVDEDAYGNKNVPFQVGLRIKADRKVEDSPTYELRAVYTNKSDSARGNLWQRVVEEEKEGGGGGTQQKELLLSFSPAGNPETIFSLWGDVYRGWLEAEIKRIMEAAKHIPLTTYVKILMAPLTADFTDWADLLSRLRQSIATAWQERERTQFVQSYNNLMSLAFDRALVPCEGLMDPQDLLDRRHLDDISGSSTLSMHLAAPLTSPGEGEQLKAVKLHKTVFRGMSFGSMLQQTRRGSRRSTDLLTQSRYGLPIHDTDKEEEDLVAQAATVRVHSTVKRYFDEMLEEGVLGDVLAHLEADPSTKLVVTGYSLGGMLSQIFLLHLGEAMLQRGLSTKHVLMMGFGSPRVGDEGFKARLKLLYPNQSCLMNVVYPLDTVHAFPPASEGYVDAVVKVFLRQPGQFVGRRKASRTNYTTPLTWLRVFDSKIDEIAHPSAAASGTAGVGEKTSSSPTDGLPHQPNGTEKCALCGGVGHATNRHRCRLCTERGSHVSAACPNKDKGCRLCGLPDHATGQHVCSVCKLHGHRGRHCHEMSEVGVAELMSYCIFHDAKYYALGTLLEDPKAVQRMANVPPPPGPDSPPTTQPIRQGRSSSTHRLLGALGGPVLLLDEEEDAELEERLEALHHI